MKYRDLSWPESRYGGAVDLDCTTHAHWHTNTGTRDATIQTADTPTHSAMQAYLGGGLGWSVLMRSGAWLGTRGLGGKSDLMAGGGHAATPQLKYYPGSLI